MKKLPNNTTDKPQRSEASIIKRRIASNKWKRNNPERAKANLARWLKENKAHRTEWTRKYNLRRKESQRVYDAERYLRPANVLKRETTKEKRKAYNRAWQKANPERNRMNDAKRKARKRGNGIGDTDVICQWVRRWRHQDQVRCYWCLKYFIPSDCSTDHIIAIARGGRHSIENLCISCTPCNMHKHDRTISFWNRFLEQPVLNL